MKKDEHLIDKLIEILSKQELTEISFCEKDFKIKIKKDCIEEINEECIIEEPVKENISCNDNIAEIKSTNIGRFYYYDKMGKPLISIGQTLKIGQTIGYISTVGIKTPVKSKTAGIIEDIYLKNGEATDYGKKLIKVKTIND